MRIHEKAQDDYASDFEDIVIAEACVVDVIRVRMVVESGEQMLELQRRLRDGYAVMLGGGNGLTSRLDLVRAKNKFSTHIKEEMGLAGLDPTHFRNILNNVQLTHGDRVVFVEMQVHHKAILTYNDASHAHDHYNYFRAKLADEYGSELDARLERAILFFGEVRGNPVLLSMLVLIFSSASDSTALPSSKLELYRDATRGALQRRLTQGIEELECAFRMLANIAVEVQLAAGQQGQQVREFRQGEHVEKALAGYPNELQLWKRMLAQPGGVPLVKVVEQGEAGPGSSFQFKHVSFQEGLFAAALVDCFDTSAARGSSRLRQIDPRSLLGSPALLNALTIGGETLGGLLSNALPDGEELELTEQELRAMNALHWRPLQGRRRLHLKLPNSSGLERDVKAAMLQRLVEGADAVGLSSLSLEGNKQLIAGETAKVLIEVLAGTSNISECNVRGAGLDEESARRLAKVAAQREMAEEKIKEQHLEKEMASKAEAMFRDVSQEKVRATREVTLSSKDELAKMERELAEAKAKAPRRKCNRD